MSPSARRHIRVSIFVVMLFQVAALFIREFVRARLGDSGMSATEAKHLSALLGFGVLGVLMWPILRDVGPALKPLFRVPHCRILALLVGVTIGLLLWVSNVLFLIWAATLQWPKFAQSMGTPALTFSYACERPAILLLAIPVMSVLTPLIEETINRGIILQALLPKGKWFAILGSAILFTVLHKIESYPTAFLFGIYAAMQVLIWKNIWVIMIIHTVFNLLVQIDLHCIDIQWASSANSLALGIPFLVSALVFLVCLVSVYVLTTKLDVGAVPK